MDYDYLDAVKSAVRDYIREEGVTPKDFGSMEGMASHLDEHCWVADSVTGNASGSYFCNRARAEECLVGNRDILVRAISEWGMTDQETLLKAVEDAEWCDVTIRCYLLNEAIWAVLNEDYSDEDFEDFEDDEEEDE